jgi:epidermal growth factor receptor substrate 15
MAAPQVLGTPSTGTGRTNNGTTHTVTLPSGIQDGEWLVVYMGIDGSVTMTAPNGWILVTTYQQGSVTGIVAIKRGLASESGTNVVFTSSGNEQSSYVAFRVTKDALWSFRVNLDLGSSTNSTFTELQTGNLYSNVDFLILSGRMGDSNTQVSAPSTDFTEVGQAVGGTNNAATYVQRKDHVFTSAYGGYTPGAVTVGNEQWVTISVMFYTPAKSGKEVIFVSPYNSPNASAPMSHSFGTIETDGTYKKYGTKITGNGGSLSHVWLMCSGGTGSAGEVYVEVMSVSGGAPGTVLATSDQMSLTAGLQGPSEAIFSTPYTLNDGTEYFIMVRNANANSVFVGAIAETADGVDYAQQVSNDAYVAVTTTIEVLGFGDPLPGVISESTSATDSCNAGLSYSVSNSESASATDTPNGTRFGEAPDWRASNPFGIDASATTSRDVTLPTGLSVGDLMFIVVSAPTANFGTIAGWIELTTNIDNNESGVYWRVRVGDEGSTVAVPTGNSVRVRWTTCAISSANGKIFPLIAFRDGISNASSFSFPNPTLKNSRSRDLNAIQIAFVGCGPEEYQTGTSSNWTTFTAWTELSDGAGVGSISVQYLRRVVPAGDELYVSGIPLNAASSGYAHFLTVAYLEEGFDEEPMQGNNGRTNTLQTWFSRQDLDDTDYGIAQSFKASGGKIEKVIGYFARSNVLQTGGTITAKIYAHSGTFGTSSVPTGSALATSNAVNISDLPVEIGAFYDAWPLEFTFSGGYQTTNNTDYVVAFEVANNGTTYKLRALLGYTTSDAGNASIYTSGAWASQNEEFQVMLIKTLDTGVKSITESTTATDTPNATKTTVADLTESTTPTDTPAATRSSTHSNTETASATDTTDGDHLFSVDLTEATSASDTPDADVIYVVSTTETASASDTPDAQRTLAVSNTETTSATDTPDAQRTLVVASTESTSATDTPNGVVTYPVSNTETATGTDTQDAVITKEVNASESATGASTQDSTLSSTQSVTETASPVSSQDAGVSSSHSVTESTTATDTPDALRTLAVSVSETTTATDTPDVDATMGASASESASASETQDSARTLGVAISESTSASDTPDSTYSTSAANTESTTASDSQDSDLQTSAAVTETVTATDSQDGAVVIEVSAQESTSATDTPAATLASTHAVTETASATETQDGTTGIPADQTESTTASDSSSATAVFLGAISETNSATETPGGSAIYPVSGSESVTATDTPNADRTASGAISEAASATDTQDAEVTGSVNEINETAAAGDSASAFLEIAVAVSETTSPSDTPACTLDIFASITESASASDTPNSESGNNIVEPGSAQAVADGLLVRVADCNENASASTSQDCIKTLAAVMVESTFSSDVMEGYVGTGLIQTGELAEPAVAVATANAAMGKKLFTVVGGTWRKWERSDE